MRRTYWLDFPHPPPWFLGSLLFLNRHSPSLAHILSVLLPGLYSHWAPQQEHSQVYSSPMPHKGSSPSSHRALTTVFARLHICRPSCTSHLSHFPCTWPSIWTKEQINTNWTRLLSVLCLGHSPFQFGTPTGEDHLCLGFLLTLRPFPEYSLTLQTSFKVSPRLLPSPGSSLPTPDPVNLCF